MNVKELIEKYKSYEGKWNAKTGELARQIFLEDLKQLDEPQPVKVPPFVADWIDYFKKTGDWDLFQAMDSLFGRRETREWLEYKNNQEIFARAWLDGYEVEEKKRYTVVMKTTKQPLYYNAGDKKLFFSLGGLATNFTQKQLEEADFGWVFSCEGIEIEEVTD